MPIVFRTRQQLRKPEGKMYTFKPFDTVEKKNSDSIYKTNYKKCIQSMNANLGDFCSDLYNYTHNYRYYEISLQN